jgi:hypothetical protein
LTLALRIILDSQVSEDNALTSVLQIQIFTLIQTAKIANQSVLWESLQTLRIEPVNRTACQSSNTTSDVFLYVPTVTTQTQLVTVSFPLHVMRQCHTQKTGQQSALVHVQVDHLLIQTQNTALLCVLTGGMGMLTFVDKHALLPALRHQTSLKHVYQVVRTSHTTKEAHARPNVKQAMLTIFWEHATQVAL